MKKVPKDIKTSIRNKYKRRLLWMAELVEGLENISNQRLQHGGNIRNREDTIKLLECLQELKKFLPEIVEEELDEETIKSLNDVFGVS